MLQAHQRSYFSLFEVLQLVPRLGARLRDLFTDETFPVVYLRLTETMRPGVVLREEVRTVLSAAELTLCCTSGKKG